MSYSQTSHIQEKNISLCNGREEEEIYGEANMFFILEILKLYTQLHSFITCHHTKLFHMDMTLFPLFKENHLE
jgi:hypothetical protein